MSYELGNAGNNLSTAQTVAALAALASTNDADAEDHGRRVAHYAKLIAEQLGLQMAQVRDIVNASVLHDIGKIAISQSILKKMGRLTPSEFEIMKIHSTVALNVFSKVDELKQIAPYIKHHHERFDGKGYPDGISGNKIPLGARIISVAETFDILISGTPWRTKCSMEEAIAEINSCSGTQFDPDIVQALCAALSDECANI